MDNNARELTVVVTKDLKPEDIKEAEAEKILEEAPARKKRVIRRKK